MQLKLNKILSGNHFHSALALGGSSALALFSFLLLARGMSKESFGQWTIYLTLLTFVDMVKSGIVQSALVKYASGLDKEGKAIKIASSWTLNITATLVVSVLLLSLFWLDVFQVEGVVYFLIFYPIYSIVSMAFFYFIWNNQLHFNFKNITKIKIVNALLFLACSFYTYFQNLNVLQLITLHCASFFVSSIVAIFWKGTGITSLKLSSKASIKQYISFGKFHSLAYLGSNLLKSSDIFIINWLLGPVQVATYSVALRLVEIIELPIKSFVNVLFPTLSAQDNKGDKMALRTTLENYLGVSTLLYVPFMIFLWIFSAWIINFIGGEKYQSAIIIFKIFIVFGLFLPFDRITGVALDALGNTKLNFYKVFIMATVNIVGDILAIVYFQSIELVALVTVLNVLAGAMVGYLFLKKDVNFNFISSLSRGYLSIQSTIHSFQKQKL